MLLELLVVLVELTKLIRQDVGVRHEVEVLLSVALLHANHVEAEPILARDLMTLREVVDLLVLVESLVEVALAAAGAPKNIPLVALSGRKTVVFEHRSDELVVEPEHLVEELTVLDVVALLVPIELHVVRHHLLLGDVLEHQRIRLVLVVVVRVRLVRVAVEEATRCTLSARHAGAHSSVGYCGGSLDRSASVWHYPFDLVLEIFDFGHDFGDLLLSFFLLDTGIAHGVESFLVHEVAGARSASVLTIDSPPVLLEVALDVLQSVQGRHLARLLGWLRWRFLAVWSILELVGWWLQPGLRLRRALTAFLIGVTGRVCKVSRVLAIIK